MKKFLAVCAVGAMLLAPASATMAVGLLMNPAVTACTNGPLAVFEIPDELTATTRSGQSVTLNKQQLTHAATIITDGGQVDGVGRDGVIIALMAALTESTLRMLANTGTYPESGDYPNDGNGADHDSLGLFQMRPQSGWGTVAELMDPQYQVAAFFGGPDGPNHPSPRGLLDIPGWEQMDRGEAVQTVEVSAHPDRYQEWEPVAETILSTLTQQPADGGGETPGTVPETREIVMPMAEGTYTITSRFGWRTDPVTGAFEDLHAGTDFSAPDGSPIVSIADGVVREAGYVPGWGLAVIIEHTVNGKRVDSGYFHMWEHGIHVRAGQQVQAGQHIADVGSSGWSTGPHLHLETHPGGWDQPAVDSLEWLQDNGATDAGTPGDPPAAIGCEA